MTAAEDYLRDVGFALRDLPWRTKRDLLSELRVHLAELPAEPSLRTQLGAPEAYAAELRAAAGLERRRGVIAFLRARRPRNLALTAAALTVIGLVIGAVSWIDSYQPLAFENGEEPPLGTVESPAGYGESVVFRKGRPFRLGLDIKNTGRFTVRVLGLSYGPGMPFSARLVMSGPMRYSGFRQTYLRFHPFDMKPGEVRVLELQGSYTNCRGWVGRTGSEGPLVDFPVRYRFLWRTATANIRLPEPLAFVYQKDSCPTP